MTRAEHVAWAKQRALEELEASGVGNAVSSIASDLTKHEETRKMSMSIGIEAAMLGDREAVRRWIEDIT